MKSILDSEQVRFMSIFGSCSNIASKYYLSGGTALCQYYIPYRLSEDLDFFSIDEINVDEIIAFLKKYKGKIGYLSYEYNTSFNRNLFFFKYANKTLKLEFTYYPFTQINKPIRKDGIAIDSVEDIATNKLFTIYQKPRARDFMDLYMICKKYNYSISELISKARAKFDTHIDIVKLGSQFIKVKEVKDFPNLIDDLDESLWINYFIEESKILGKKIISQ